MKIDLTKYLRLTATLTTETGLRVGSGKGKVEIGGLDQPVLKDPEGFPYIPGSSLKGKLRSLLEYVTSSVSQPSGGAWSWADALRKNERDRSKARGDAIIRIFGALPPREKTDQPIAEIGPSRIIVRDCRLSGDAAKKQPSELTEIKPETAINRITGTALGGSLRDNERIPAGVTFNMEIVFRCFEFDDNGGVTDEELFYKHIPRALELLEMDCLGGYGSRGYGKVSLSGLTLKEDDKVIGEWKTVAEFKANPKNRG